MEQIKLDLGAGKIPMKGYINIDINAGPFIDIVHDVRKMKELYKNGTVDEIMAIDVLEHLGLWKWKQALNDWVDLLKDGGVLKLRVPDIKKMIYYFNVMEKVEGYDDREQWDRFLHILYGDQDYPENTHINGFTEEYLVSDLTKMGMVVKPCWTDGGVNLRVVAIKGNHEPLTTLDHLDYNWKEYQLNLSKP